MGPAPMGLGDRLDDRHAEPAPTTGARRVGAGETIEGALDEVRWEPGPFVGDMDLDLRSLSPCRERDPSVTVAERVLDQVGDGLFEAQGIGANA